MKKLLFLFCFTLFCTTNNSFFIQAQQNKLFEQFKQSFLDQYWALNPESAAYSGLAQYDSILTIPSAEKRAQDLATYQQLLKMLKAFDVNQLPPADRTDYALIKNALLASQWYMETFKQYEWNPSTYNVGGGFDQILSNKELSVVEKLQKISPKLKQVPAYYQTAQANIKQPTMEHTQLAIYQIGGILSVFDKKLSDFIKNASTVDLISAKVSREKMEEDLVKAADAVRAYGYWLEHILLPSLNEKTARSFRIGKELYTEKFKYDIESQYTAEEIYQFALQEKAAIHLKMKAITDMIWAKYFISPRPANDLVATKQLIEHLSKQHVHRDSFMTAIKQQLPELVAFVNFKNLVHLDPDKPLEVRATPEYMRGVAGASISAPGPYDKQRPTYYNVTPLDHYTDEQAESYLREYNHYMLQILNIHEAIPGHYTQLIYSNQSPSLIKSIFGNGAMIEGWACYTERMMLEEGYGNFSPELWLMYYKWNLRIVCNTILDYGVQVLGMTQEQAIQLLTQEAFQEQTEAEGKWRRAQLTQVQLCSYFTGLTEIYHFREEYKTRLGAEFNLKEFHEQFLSYGSAPVSEIRALMLSGN